MGEISTTCYVDIAAVARDVVKGIGYDDPACGFDGNTCAVITSIDAQSPDIAMGVNESLERKTGETDAEDLLGAGDQGMMFGYACDETPELMPLPISLAHRLANGWLRFAKTAPCLIFAPTAKPRLPWSMTTPARCGWILWWFLPSMIPTVTLEQIRADILEHVIKAELPPELLDSSTKVYVNPTGRFVVGGPVGDSGLTGRKLIVDTYGGYARHGGGAFSGKDPTKVDRSAAYAARYVAKNIVGAGLASQCEVQLAYAIGVARPVSILVDTYGTGKVADDALADAVSRVFDLRPAAIIRDLGLRAPIYRQLAAYGHLGREELNVAWEKLDKVDALKAALHQ